MSRTATILIMPVVLAVFLLGYGYWTAISFGYLALTLEVGGHKITNAKIQFRGENKELLAKGHTDNAFGIVYLDHPETGSCEAMEKQAPFSSEARKNWQNCSDTVARWTVKWAPLIRFVNIESPSCNVQLLPASAESFREQWWLWWVPLPHIGGRPYTYFRVEIPLEKVKGCQ